MAPKIVDPEERRLHIAGAAAQVFVEKGFAAATINDIAVRAGMGKGTLYLYFKSKQEIFIALFEAYTEKVADQSRARMEALEDDPKEALISLTMDWAQAILDALPIYSLVMEFWGAATMEEVRDIIILKFKNMYSLMRSLIITIVQRGQESGLFHSQADPLAVASMLIGALDGLGLQVWVDRTVDVKRIAAGFMDTLFVGLEADSI